MNIRPFRNQVLIAVLPPDSKTDGGLFLPDVAQFAERGEKPRPRRGTVLAIGAWRTTKQGLAILPDFRPGDQVIISEHSGTKLTRTIGENLRLCNVEDVLAKVDETS